MLWGKPTGSWLQRLPVSESQFWPSNLPPFARRANQAFARVVDDQKRFPFGPREVTYILQGRGDVLVIEMGTVWASCGDSVGIARHSEAIQKVALSGGQGSITRRGIPHRLGVLHHF